jgi:hypothetical protein
MGRPNTGPHYPSAEVLVVVGAVQMVKRSTTKRESNDDEEGEQRKFMMLRALFYLMRGLGYAICEISAFILAFILRLFQFFLKKPKKN